MLEHIEQLTKYPSTRFMGSKRKIVDAIWDVCKDFPFDSVLDLFSGSGIVGYMFKCHGKEVTTNDYMSMAATYGKALIENNLITLSLSETDNLLKEIPNDGFVEKTFGGLYFSDDENRLIDIIRTNIQRMSNQYKQAIAMCALIRTCIKKRPRGIFTYTGERYNDGRRDLQISFEQHFREAVDVINNAVFSNDKKNRALWGDSLSLDEDTKYDLVYLDPPYYTPKSDNEYVRRYHFIEGLSRNWEGVNIQQETKTKKFKSYPTPFSTEEGATKAFNDLFKKYKDSILVVSYSSNSLPTKDEIINLLSKYKKHTKVVPIDYKYSFGTRNTVKRNDVQEYLFVGW